MRAQPSVLRARVNAQVRSASRGFLLLAARKRALRLHCQLLSHFIFFQLILYVLLYPARVFACCVYIVSPAPKLSAPVFVLQLPELFIQHRTALPFQVSHETRHCLLCRFSANMCMCSGHTSPSMNFTFFQLHNFLCISPISFLFSPQNTFHRYCRTNTIIILNHTIYKIFKKTFRFTVPVRGAPASNHILYDCQMQNNFLYKDDEYLRKYQLLFLTQPEY